MDRAGKDEDATDTRKEEREWLRDQLKSYLKVAGKYELYTEKLREILEKAANRYAKGAIVQVRLKSISGFGEKAIRKKNKYHDPINRITDLCGGRVITSTLSEVEAINKFIENHFEIDWDNTLDVGDLLKSTEFGYLSKHYIVSFKPDTFPTEDIKVNIPQELYGLKAEIQVRTLLQHTWAVFYHDRAYKGAFKIPDKWERELANIAAMLEGADKSLDRIQTGLKRYEASYESYMSEQDIRDKIDNLETLLKYDPKNVELAACIGKLSIAIGDMKKAEDVLSRYAESGYPSILRDLGVAKCKLYADKQDSEEYRQGQRYLEAAVERDNKDTDAMASLAGTWKGIDEDKARELYKQAFEADPTDPYPLGNYIEYEIIDKEDTSVIDILRPVIEQAIQRCRDQADVGMNIPWAFYDIGKLKLLLGMPFEGLEAYAKAIRLTNAEFMLESSLRSLQKLSIVKDQLPGYSWIVRLLLIGLAVKFPSDKWAEQVKELSSHNLGGIKGPVVIVVGGCNGDSGQKVQDYRPLMMEAFRDFNGTVISGGTPSGIAGIVGNVGEKYNRNIHTIGYVPKDLKGISIDKRYNEIISTAGSSFSPLEPLQYWIDIVSSGISPEDIRLIGFDGGSIAASEYNIALALGVHVGHIEDSGGEPAKLLKDGDWGALKTPIRIPEDTYTVRTFIGPSRVKMANEFRDAIAEAIHDDYRQTRLSGAHEMDPAMVMWSELSDDLRDSSRGQADHIYEKLGYIGCSVHEVTDRPVPLMTFTEEEIEIMAEMEHGRWNTERLLKGWTWAKERDHVKKTSPYIVSWSKLPEKVKEWDRRTVHNIPEFLARVGLEIRRKEKRNE